MKRILGKLNNTRGASILFALLVFLLCAFAGAAALTAAASNSGRFRHAESDQQQYLSVASAVKLFRQELSTPKLVFTRDFVETKDWWYVESNGVYTLKEEINYDLKSTEKTWSDIAEDGFFLEAILESYCKSFFEAEYVPSDWYVKKGDPMPEAATAKELIITGKDELEEKLDKVHVQISLDLNTSTMTVKFGAGDDPNKLAYETALLIPIKSSYHIESSVTNSGDSAGDKGTTTTTTTVTLTIEWSDEKATVVNEWEGQQDAEPNL